MSRTVLIFVIIFFFFCISIPSGAQASLSTLAITNLSNLTVVCALVPSDVSGSRHQVNCTALPLNVQRSYRAGVSSYTAIAAGDGFLCALASPPFSGKTTMRWWDLHQTRNNETEKPKRLYFGSYLSDLEAGGSHVCAIVGNSGKLGCWRWDEISFSNARNFGYTGIAVGDGFLCGLNQNQTIKCFGNNTNVVGKEPSGRYRIIAASRDYACGVKKSEFSLFCWGLRVPKIEEIDFQISSLALGDNQICALATDGRVRCWGERFLSPEEQFVSIQGRGNSFCGVLAKNFSLFCWGNEIFVKSSIVYDRVLPGACVTNCSCGFLPGSGNLCPDGAAICRTCEETETPTLLVPLSPSYSSDEKSKARDKNMIFIMVGGGGFLFCLVAAGIFLCCRNGRCLRVHDSPPRADFVSGKGNNAVIKEFFIEDLKIITGGFSDEHRVGSGSFGAVYRATLDDGHEVAIKRAENSSSSSHNKEEAFLAELAMLSRVNHKNLVRLLGFCSQSGERILVYEFVSNGTLSDHLHKIPSSPLHSWDRRLRAALDAARGIEYLHCYAVPPIIHRDIKSSNILLDNLWTAKVSDFGLSLMGPEDEESHLSLRAAGTVGYMDPEYYRMQYLTTKSDVYSFGVVLLELLTGFKAVHQQEHDEEDDGFDDDDDDGDAPRNVVDFAVPNIEDDQVHLVLDKRLVPPKPSEIESVQCLAYLAADCVNAEGRNRPTMTEVVAALERAVAACSVVPRSLSTRSL